MRIISDENYSELRKKFLDLAQTNSQPGALWKEIDDLINGLELSDAKVTLLPEDQLKIVNKNINSNINVYLTRADGTKVQIRGIIQEIS